MIVCAFARWCGTSAGFLAKYGVLLLEGCFLVSAQRCCYCWGASADQIVDAGRSQYTRVYGQNSQAVSIIERVMGVFILLLERSQMGVW